MQRVTFGRFLQNTTVYEHLPVPIDPSLRRGAWVSWLIACVCWPYYWILPDGNYLYDAAFFLLTSDWMITLWDMVATHKSLFLNTCTLMFVLFLIIYIRSNRFQQAGIWMQVGLFIPIILAVVNLLIILALLLPILLNFALWICVALVFLVAVAAFLGVLFWALSR